MADPSVAAGGSGALAKTTVRKLLECWHLSYKYSIKSYPLSDNKRTQVHVIFSKPSPQLPSPLVVAHFEFYLEPNLTQVTGFTIENEHHFHSILEIKFDEKLIDQVIRRKLHLKDTNRIDLQDDFMRSRIPKTHEQIVQERRHKHQEMLEEMLLEAFQRKDVKNKGKIPFAQVHQVLYTLDLGISNEERFVLFGFVDQDRDELVDYNRSLAVLVQAIDTMVFAPESQLDRGRDGTGDTSSDPSARHLHELLEILQYNEVEYNLQVLRESFEQKVKANSEGVVDPATTTTTTGAGAAAAAAAAAGEATEASESSDAKASGSEVTSTPGQDKTTSQEKQHETHAAVELSISKPQFRECLTSTELVVSKLEFNLLLAFGAWDSDNYAASSREAEAKTSVALTDPLWDAHNVPFARVAKLLRRIRRQVFRFQAKAFHDELETFLHHNFRDFERSQLPGTREHLQGKIPLHQVKTLLRDCQKLMLSPFQMHQLLCLAHDSMVQAGPGSGQAKSRASQVDYVLLVPEMTRVLQQQVDLQVLHAQAQWLKNQACVRPALVVDAHRWATVRQQAKDQLSREFASHSQSHRGFLQQVVLHESLWHLRTLFQLEQRGHVSHLALILDANQDNEVNCDAFVDIVTVFAQFLATQRALAQR